MRLFNGHTSVIMLDRLEGLLGVYPLAVNWIKILGTSGLDLLTSYTKILNQSMYCPLSPSRRQKKTSNKIFHFTELIFPLFRDFQISGCSSSP